MKDLWGQYPEKLAVYKCITYFKKGQDKVKDGAHRSRQPTTIRKEKNSSCLTLVEEEQ